MTKRLKKRRPLADVRVKTDGPTVVDALVKVTGCTREEAEAFVRPAAAECTLCGRPPAYVGLFFPDDPQKYGAPAGKTRVVVYGLCETCNSRPGVADEAEAKILRDLTRH